MTKSVFGQLDGYLAKKGFGKIIQAVNVGEEIRTFLGMPSLTIVYKQKKIYISGATAVERQHIQLISQDLINHMNELAITVVRIIFTY